MSTEVECYLNTVWPNTVCRLCPFMVYFLLLYLRFTVTLNMQCCRIRARINLPALADVVCWQIHFMKQVGSTIQLALYLNYTAVRQYNKGSNKLFM